MNIDPKDLRFAGSVISSAVHRLIQQAAIRRRDRHDVEAELLVQLLEVCIP